MKSPTSHPARAPIYRRIHYRFLRRNEHSSGEAGHEARSLVSNVLRRRNFVHSSFDEQKGKRRTSEKRKMLKRGIEPQTFALLARRSNQLSYSSTVFRLRLRRKRIHVNSESYAKNDCFEQSGVMKVVIVALTFVLCLIIQTLGSRLVGAVVCRSLPGLSLLPEIRIHPGVALLEL